MTRNLLAAIGLAVVVQKSYVFFRHYQGLKREAELWRNAGQRGTPEEAR